MSLFHQNCERGQYYGHNDQGKNKFQVLAHAACRKQDFNKCYRDNYDENILDPFSCDLHKHPSFLAKQASASDPDDNRQKYNKHHSHQE